VSLARRFVRAFTRSLIEDAVWVLIVAVYLV
jgi:hypothetical protein